MGNDGESMVKTTWIGDVQKGQHDGEQVELKGWVKRARGNNNIRFIVLRDSTGTIQCVGKKANIGEEAFDALKGALIETSVVFSGTVRADERAEGGHELDITAVQIVGPVNSERPFPITEADMLVEHILENDENVFEQLLTTERFFVYHSGDNKAMDAGAKQLKKVYQKFRNLDWQTWEPEDIAPHRDFLMTIWEFRKTRGGDNKALLTTLKRMMPALESHFSDGQSNGMPYMKMAMGFWHGGNVLGRTGQQMRGEQVTSYWNLDWKTWDYPTQQPASIANRKGLLTHPAWLIAHSQNLETDPIHRGKWIREKLLAGTIPDVPITVDAVIPPDHHRTLRQRMEKRTGDAYCWRCHQKMDPLGFPFESFDDFGRFRTKENLEHPDNLIKEAKRGETNEFGASLPVYKTLPVDTRGVLDGTDDAKLDGTVVDAFDLIDRLAASAKVRQSIIRHAFRYFLGRNERLSDSATLMAADKAYVDSNGSFDEVIVSLLTSDSFIYRKSTSQD